MQGKLFQIICPRLKKMYKTKIFYCTGKNKYTGHNFVNINSGTFVVCAAWGKYEISEIEINKNYRQLIDDVLKTKKTKRFIEMYQI